MNKSLFHILLSLSALVSALSLSAQEAPPPPGPGPRPMMSPFENWGRGNDIIVVMEELKKNDPETYTKLAELRKSDLTAFMAEIKKHLPKDKYPMRKMFKLETECRSLALTIADCKDEAVKEKLQEMLRDKIKESFDFMISDSTERIEKMRKQLEALKANEESFLEERYKQFTSPEFIQFLESKSNDADARKNPRFHKNAPMPPEPPQK